MSHLARHAAYLLTRRKSQAASDVSCAFVRHLETVEATDIAVCQISSIQCTDFDALATADIAGRRAWVPKAQHGTMSLPKHSIGHMTVQLKWN